MHHLESITYVSTAGTIILAVSPDKSPFWWDYADGLSGETNSIYTYRGAGQDGATLAGTVVEPRYLTFGGLILHNQDFFRALMLQIITPKSEATITYTNGTTKRYLRCVVQQAPQITNETLPRWQFTLCCPYPHWRDGDGSSQHVADIALWVPALSFPVEIPAEGLELEIRSPSLIVNVVNTGHVPSGMMIEFRAKGTTANPYIINVQTQKMLKINRDMEPGDIIRVWTAYGEKRVELTRAGIVTNVFNDFDDDGEFLHLNLGDNLIRYGADVIDNLEVSIYYDLAFVGV